MKKKLTSILLSLVLTLSMVTSMPFSLNSIAEGTLSEESAIAQQNDYNSGVVASTLPEGGSGTVDDPYQIALATELLWYCETVNDATVPNPNICAKLVADIDMSSVCSPELGNWTPISCSGEYSGTFDGNGYEIKNLYINSTENYQSLFGNVARATIKNLGVVDCNVTGWNFVGGIVAGSAYTIVENCYVTGSVTGNENVGGIYGSFGMCMAGNDISAAKVSGNTNVGVICGKVSRSTFTNSIGIKTEDVPLFGANIDATTENVIEMADLSTGEACYFMNGNSSINTIWYQNIGEGGDKYPVLDSTHGVVYKTDGGFACCNDHSNQIDGFCHVCGKFVSDGLTPDAEGFYEIDTAKKLLWYSYYVNCVNETANAKLISDIDLSTVCGENIGNWKPIGDYANHNIYYKGTFDGNGHTISNLYINTTDMYAGLFGNTSRGSVYNKIKNINLVNVDVTGGSYSAGLCGINCGIISHCSVSGKVNAAGDYFNIGGVCGYNSSYSTITDCSNDATVSVTGNNSKVGGICGSNYSNSYFFGTVTECFNTGSITASGDNNKVGPVIGLDNDTAYSVVTGNYYLDTAETDSLEGTTFKTDAQFKSGEVAYLLNKGVTDGTQPWYQTCHEGYPEISGKTVYAYTNCKGIADYTNNASLQGTVGQHNYVNGICSSCGGFETAVIITAENRGNYGLDSTYDGYYAISNSYQLKWFADTVNAGNASANAVLVNNIDMSGVAWTSIVSFSGVLDGNGFEICNLCANAGLGDGARPPLFITLNTTAVVKNLSMTGADIFIHAPGRNDAVIAENNNGFIKDCVVKDCTVKGGAYSNSLGAVAASNNENGTIENCCVINTKILRMYSAATSKNSGAIADVNDGVVKNCYAYNCEYTAGVIKAGIVASGKAPQNSYYYSTSAIESTIDGVAVTKEQFSSGEVAAMLQEGCTETTWGQGDNDTFPVLTSDETLVRKRVTFKYNDTTETKVLKYNEKIMLPKVETEDGAKVLYWAKADGTVFRATENVVSGTVLTAVMSYTKIVVIENSKLSLDRTDNIVLSEAVKDGRTVKDYKDNFKNDNNLIVIENASGKALSDTDIVGTGCVIKSLYAFDGETVVDSVIVVIKGDVNGDGLINNEDYSIVKSNIFNGSLTGVYLTAADICKDGVIDAFDAYYVDLIGSSVNEKNKYKVPSEQTFAQLKEHFGEDIAVYNPDGEIVTDENVIFGAGTKVEYIRNGLTISQLVEIVAS